MSIAIFTKGITVGMQITQNDRSAPCVRSSDSDALMVKHRCRILCALD